MTIAFGAEAINSDFGTPSTTHTVSITLSTGDLAILAIANRDGDGTNDVASVVGSVNTTGWARAGSISICDALSQDGIAEIWFKDNCTGGSETVTVTHDAASRPGISLTRWTRDAAVSVEDSDIAEQESIVSTHSMGSVTTAGAALVISALVTDGGTWHANTGAGCTALSFSAGRLRGQWRIVTTGGTYSDSMTTDTAQYSATSTVAFAEAAGGPSNAAKAAYLRMMQQL